MYSFLKIFIVVVLALALIDWIADRDRRADTNIPNAKPGWALLSGDIKIASANANENPIGTVPPGESFLPGDIKYESPNGNVPYLFSYRDSDHPLNFVHSDPSFHRHKADVIVVPIHVRFCRVRRTSIKRCGMSIIDPNMGVSPYR